MGSSGLIWLSIIPLSPKMLSYIPYGSSMRARSTSVLRHDIGKTKVLGQESGLQSELQCTTRNGRDETRMKSSSRPSRNFSCLISWVIQALPRLSLEFLLFTLVEIYRKYQMQGLTLGQVDRNLRPSFADLKPNDRPSSGRLPADVRLGLMNSLSWIFRAKFVVRVAGLTRSTRSSC